MGILSLSYPSAYAEIRRSALPAIEFSDERALFLPLLSPKSGGRGRRFMPGQKAIREASTKPIYTGYSEGLEKVI